MQSISNEYLASARINDRVREASRRTAPVRNRGGLALIVAKAVAVVKAPTVERRPAVPELGS